MRIAPLSAGGFRAQGRTRCGCASPPSARGGPGRRWPGGVSASATAAAEVAASAATGVERRDRSGVVAAAPLPRVLNFCLHVLGIRNHRRQNSDCQTHLVLRCPGDSTEGKIVDGIGARATQHSARSSEDADVSAARAADANNILSDVHCKNKPSHSPRHGSPHHRPAAKGANSEVDDVDCGNIVIASKYALKVSRCETEKILFPERHRLDISVHSDVDVRPLWINQGRHCCGRGVAKVVEEMSASSAMSIPQSFWLLFSLGRSSFCDSSKSISQGFSSSLVSVSPSVTRRSAPATVTVTTATAAAAAAQPWTQNLVTQ